MEPNYENFCVKYYLLNIMSKWKLSRWIGDEPLLHGLLSGKAARPRWGFFNNYHLPAVDMLSVELRSHTRHKLRPWSIRRRYCMTIQAFGNSHWWGYTSAPALRQQGCVPWTNLSCTRWADSSQNTWDSHPALPLSVPLPQAAFTWRSYSGGYLSNYELG